VAHLLHRLNRQLQPIEVVVKGSLKGDRLQLLLEAADVPSQEITVAVVRRTLTMVQLPMARSVNVYGRSVGEAPSWHEGWLLDNLLETASQLQLLPGVTPLNSTQNPAKVSSTIQPDDRLGSAVMHTFDRKFVVGTCTISALAAFLFTVGYPMTQAIKLSGLPASTSPVSSPSPSASPIAPPRSTQTVNAQPLSGFRHAINKATQAANYTQTAHDRQDWRQVADLWQESIGLLQTVATTDKHYAIAQHKIPEYQRNFVYAQQRLQQLPNAAKLGMTQQSIQAVFQQTTFGFQFENATPLNYQPRVTGRSPNGFALLELLGTSDNLAKVTIVVGLPPDDAVANALSVTYLLGLLQAVFPQWQQSSEWLSHGIEQLSVGDQNHPDSGNFITVRDNKRIKLSAIGELGTMVLAIEPE
jgi:hypothetical protein